MSAETLAILGVGVAILVFLWTLHRDVSSLRERMAKMEGQIDGMGTAVEALEGQISILKDVVISSINTDPGPRGTP